MRPQAARPPPVRRSRLPLLLLLLSPGWWGGSTAPSPVATADAQEAATDAASGELRIPRILHHIFLSGEDEYARETQKPGASLKTAWRDSCVAAYPGWQYRFWTEDDALAFVEQSYPDFAPTYRSFAKFVLRGDSLRYLLLHAFGGLYVDLDVQCFGQGGPVAGEAMLAGYDVVLQGHHHKEPLINAMMASVPGHPIFAEAVAQITRRAAPEVMSKWSSANDAVLYTVGPRMLGDAVAGFINASDYRGFVERPHDVQGTRVRVYDVGAWFQPCLWGDCPCHTQMTAGALEGRIPDQVVGYHHFTATWASLMNRQFRICRLQITSYLRGKELAPKMEATCLALGATSVLLMASLLLAPRTWGALLRVRRSPELDAELLYNLHLLRP